MTMLQTEADPAELGFDPSRLQRIDRHFARYVDDGRLPGWLALVARGGRVVHLSTCGQRDVEAGTPVEVDSLFRIYSMTKPITSVAALMLFEEGAVGLHDPVSRFIPSFADVTVYRSGSALNPVVGPAVRPVTIWNLLTHTAGLTYGFHHATPVDAMYRQRGFEWITPEGSDLAACCDAWAQLPLLFQPGSEWHYSVATDVLGRVVEVASGMDLDAFLRQRILEPLGMADTAFTVRPDDAERLAALYVAAPGSRTPRRYDDRATLDPTGGSAPLMLSGGAGLVSSASDYHRFAQLLLGGGELDGVRLLSSRTLAFMTRNHLPGGVDLASYGRALFAETGHDGVGFGLGVSVMLDPVRAGVLSSVGEFGWGGAASTCFFVDPAEELSVLFLTQLLPSSTHPIRRELKQLVYQALVD